MPRILSAPRDCGYSPSPSAASSARPPSARGGQPQQRRPSSRRASFSSASAADGSNNRGSVLLPQGGGVGGGLSRPSSATSQRGGNVGKGGRSFSRARVPTLSVTLAKDIGLRELQGRAAVVEEEADERAAMLSSICSMQILERVNMLVLTCVDACRYSREFFYADEERERVALLHYHKAQMKYLRSIIPIEVVLAKIRTANADEKNERKALWYLEQKTLQDLCDIFNIQNNYGLARKQGSAVAGPRQEGAVVFIPTLYEFDEAMYDYIRNYQDPRKEKLLESAEIYQSLIHGGLHPPAAMPAPPYAGEGGSGMSAAKLLKAGAPPPAAAPIKLTDGCPFVNPRDCPFYDQPWVDGASFVCSHMRRQYPPLRFDTAAAGDDVATTGLSYDLVSSHREEVTSGMHPLIFSIAGDAVVSRVPMRPQSAPRNSGGGGHGDARAERLARLAHDSRHLPVNRSRPTSASAQRLPQGVMESSILNAAARRKMTV